MIASSIQRFDVARWPSCLLLAAILSSGKTMPAAAELPPASTLQPVKPNSEELAASLQLWLRADDLELKDGELVHVWPDRSGNGRDVSATKGVRADGVGLPATFVKESALQRRPAVRFATTTGLASSPDHPVEIRGDAELTMLVVINLQPHEAQPPYDGIFGIGNPAYSGDPGKPMAALLQINRGEDHALHFAGGWNHDASLGNGSFKSHYGKSLILTVTKKPGPMRTMTRFYLNGEEAVPTEGRETLPDIQHRSDIGAYLGKATNWAGSILGDVGEVLLYNKALSEDERLAVECHLAEKFGVMIKPLLAAAEQDAFTAEEKNFWAYQPVKNVLPPTVQQEVWIQSPLDRFILAKMEERSLTPSPETDRRTLLRRITFGLTGLPPTPDEIDSFLHDDSPTAYETVVDRLLESPDYGEHWARHWLDVVRYAESTANDANAVMRYACRYRNYVIDAFNQDLPYDQFLVEQLAGDLLPATEIPELNARRIIATGFLMIGPKALAETDKEQSRLDIVDDQIDVTGRAFLGLTLACARCHDHKFDAIRASDYYALAGIFRSTEPFQNEVRNASMWWEYPVAGAPGTEPITVMAPKDALPRNLRIHLRGNRFTLGSIVPRGFLRVLSPPPTTAEHLAALPASGRLELARWIAARENPLTARVMVNRIWQHHFGRGIVGTSDNFGMRGDRPSHPELLDWLATRFMEGGWSVKTLQRTIVLSNAYRQQTSRSPETDPENRWLSTFPRRRLSAEELRDAVLAVSGQLDHQVGGFDSGEFLFQEAQDIKAQIRPNQVGADHSFYTQFRKRSIYLPIVRNMMPDVLTLFDGADPNNVTAVRNDTTVPSQSLFLLNSPFLREQSRQFAERLFADAFTSDELRLQQAHRFVFGRPASAPELQEGQHFLSEYLAATAAQARPESERRLAAWQSYCQILFCENEFLYVE